MDTGLIIRILILKVTLKKEKNERKKKLNGKN